MLGLLAPHRWLGWESGESKEERVEEFQLLPFSTRTTGAGDNGGGGVMFGGMEEELVEDGGPGGTRQGGGGEQQLPQLVQDRGAALVLTLPYGFMAASTEAQHPRRAH